MALFYSQGRKSVGKHAGNILVLHKGGSGGVRGTEVVVIQTVRAFSDAGFGIVIARNLPIMDEALLPYTVALLDFTFPEIMMDGRKISLPLLAYFRALGQLINIINKYDIKAIYASGGLPCQLAVPAARLKKVKVFCHFHHPVNARSYYLWLVKYVDHCIFPSQFTRTHTLAKANIDGEVIYIGIDPLRYRPVERRDLTYRYNIGIPEDAVVVAQIGHLTEHKRPLFLLQAFLAIAPQIPSLHLCIIGQGPLEKKLREQVAASRLQDRITLTGRVVDLVPYFQHVVDINVMVSREEGLGISIIEGASCGLPAIITNCTGLKETIEDGHTGFSFPIGDQVLLSKLIQKLALDAELRKKMGNSARELVARKFSLKNYQHNIVRSLKILLND